MKMKFWDRIILRIGAVLTFLGGVLTAVCGAMIYGMNLGEGIVMQSIPLTLICAGVVIALISLYNLLMPRRYHNGRHAFVVQPTEMGELRIAVSAIENLILKCVETHKEVKVQDIAITNRRGAVSVQALAEASDGLASVRTFAHGGREYTITGVVYGRQMEADAWAIVPHRFWSGQTYTRNELHAAYDAGDIERGNHRGHLVKVRGQVCVLEAMSLFHDASAALPLD